MGRIVKLATKADRKRPCDKDLKNICNQETCHTGSELALANLSIVLLLHLLTTMQTRPVDTR